MTQIKRLDVEEIVLFWEELKELYSCLSDRVLRKHDLFNTTAECAILGLFDGDHLIGMYSTYLSNGPWGPFARIENVVVAENYRGKGMGKLLVVDAINRAKNAGCYRVELSCLDEKEGFYRKCGFDNQIISMKKYLED